MSLNWNVTNIEDKDFLWLTGTQLYGNTAQLPIGIDAETKYLNPKVESVIWATMLVDMGEVTNANKVEFYLRYLLWQRVHGYDLSFTFNELEKCVGLTTNVITYTNAAWRKEFMKREGERLTKLIKDGIYNEL